MLISPVSLIMASLLYSNFKDNKYNYNKITEDDLKFISVLVPAYNEEKNIKKKIENILSLDYPKNKLEIIIGSDGSYDNTVNICKEYARHFNNIICLDEKRGGKVNIINRMVSIAKGDYILITDADTQIITKDALKKAQSLNKEFVSAKIIHPKKSRKNLDYKIRSFESKFGKLLTSNGAFMFINKHFYFPILEYIIADDFYIPLQVLINKGETILCEEIVCSSNDEDLNFFQYLKKRIRVIKGGMQTAFTLVGEIFLHDFLAFVLLLSHKVLRWYILPISLLNIYIFFGKNALLISVLIIFGLLFIKKTRILILELIIPIILTFNIKGILNKNFSGWDTERT